MLSIPVTQKEYEVLNDIKKDLELRRLVSAFISDDSNEFCLHIAEPVGNIYKIDELGWKNYFGDDEKGNIYLKDLAYIVSYSEYLNLYKDDGYIFELKERE